MCMYLKKYRPKSQSGRIIFAIAKMEFTCIRFLSLCTHQLIGRKLPGYGKFYQTPPYRLSYLMYVLPKMNSKICWCWSVDVLGLGAIQCAVVGLRSGGTCRSRTLIYYVVPGSSPGYAGGSYMFPSALPQVPPPRLYRFVVKSLKIMFGYFVYQFFLHVLSFMLSTSRRVAPTNVSKCPSLLV